MIVSIDLDLVVAKVNALVDLRLVFHQYLFFCNGFFSGRFSCILKIREIDIFAIMFRGLI